MNEQNEPIECTVYPARLIRRRGESPFDTDKPQTCRLLENGSLDVPKELVASYACLKSRCNACNGSGTFYFYPPGVERTPENRQEVVCECAKREFFKRLPAEFRRRWMACTRI
jgi:hypothetical protein